MTGNPVVTVNRAVAAAMADGPSAGLEILDGLDDSGWRAAIASPRCGRTSSRWPATLDGAVEHYRTAARLTTNLAEQRHLAMQAARASRSRLA